MGELILAMSSILLTWAILLPAFTGLGLLIRRLLGSQEQSGEYLLLSFWLGVAGAIALLQVWSLLFPITWQFSLAIIALGLIGMVLHAPQISGVIAPSWREQRLFLALALAAAVWLANRSVGPANADDSGLYHFSSILWANEHAVVPGLGNLAATLALNNASFLYTAMLNVWPWDGRVEHIANGLLLLGFWLQVVFGFALLHSARASSQPGNRNEMILRSFWILMLPPAVMLAIAKDVSSPKTDLPAGIFVVVSAYWLLRMAVAREEPESAANRKHNLLSLAILCSAAVCIKLSMIVVAGAIGIAACILWVRQMDQTRQLSISSTALAKPLAVAAGIVALFLGPWMARSVLLSGYPLFPAKVLPVAVEWRVPVPAIDYLQGAIRNHAKGGMQIWLSKVVERSPARWYAKFIKPPFEDRDGVQGFNWVKSWLLALPLSSPIEILLPLGIGGGAAFVMVRSSKRVNHLVMALLVLPFVAGLAFWVWAGPDARYGWPIAWSLAGCCIAMATALASIDTRRIAARLMVLSLVAVLPVFAYRAGVHVMLGRETPLPEVLVYGAGADAGFHARPHVELKPIVNRWNVTIYVPAEENKFHCWNGPLPCTGWPPLDPDLRMRRDGDLQSGFVIDREKELRD